MYCVTHYWLHVLCHTLLITCTVSHTTDYMYCVTRYWLHVLCHTLLITCTVSHITDYMYCVTHYWLHVLCHTLLITCTVSHTTDYMYCVTHYMYSFRHKSRGNTLLGWAWASPTLIESMGTMSVYIWWYNLIP